MTFRKQPVNWGENLVLEVHYAPGGLAGAHRRIAAEFGNGYGTRMTFSKLFRLSEPPTEGIDLERACLLLAALDQDPAEWGIDVDAVPPAVQRALADFRSRCVLQAEPIRHAIPA